MARSLTQATAASYNPRTFPLACPVLDIPATPTTTEDPTGAAMRQVDAVIRARLSSQVTLIDQISSYIVGAGGKRIRPRLVLLFSEALGFDGPERYELAAIVEFMLGALLENPQRVGGELQRELAGMRSARRGAYLDDLLQGSTGVSVVIEFAMNGLTGAFDQP